MIQNLGSMEQPYNVHLKLPMVLENDMETDTVKEIPPLASQRQEMK